MTEAAEQHILASYTPVRVFKDNINRDVLALAVFPDGRRMVTGSADHMVRLWDLREGVLLKETKGYSGLHRRSVVGHHFMVGAVAVSRDGRFIASGDHEGKLIAWDGDTGEPLTKVINAHSRWINISHVCITSLDFSPGGEVLASCSADGSTKLWSTRTWQQLGNSITHRSIFSIYGLCVRYSPSGQLLAITTARRNIEIWNTGTMTCVAKFKGHAKTNITFVWTPDGKRLLSAGNRDDPTIREWDTSTWQQVGDPWKGHTRMIKAIALNPTATLLASASSDNQVRIWRLSDQRTLATFHHIAPVYGITFSTDGKYILSGGCDRIISEWAIPSELLEGLPDAPTTSNDALLEHTMPEDSPTAQADASHHEELHRRPFEAEGTIRMVIGTQLDNTPPRLLDTTTGFLCDREAQISAFKMKTEYRQLLSSIAEHPDLQTELIQDAVEMYFRCVMLSHRWEGNEPRLHHIKDLDIYKLKAPSGIVKLQSFCKVARDEGYQWAWVDSCCIDQDNNVELQKSLNSMFAWYRRSALTIIYLSDVPPSSKSGALTKSAWNTRGWTVPEFLASKVIRFYQQDWTLYLNDQSLNHKESTMIMEELEDATGIDTQALVAFQPGMRGAREKLQWASTRVTTVPEDIAYSLFGIFGVQLPILYGEKKQNALGRLLQEIVAQSGDITGLDWVGQSSEFNSCLPASISSYEAFPCAPPSLSEDEVLASVSSLRNIVAVESVSGLYSRLVDVSPARFAHRRLQLPCIVFRVTEVRRKLSQTQETYFTYEVKADGLRDLLITTEDKLVQFSRLRPTRQAFVLVRPWDRYLLELPNTVDETQTEEDWPEPGSPLHDSPGSSPGDHNPYDSELSEQSLRLMVRLGQSFGAFLLAQQRGGEYKRIASDHDIIAQVQDMASVHHMMDVKRLEIL